MNIAPRFAQDEDGRAIIRGIVLVVTSEEESVLLDAVFGELVGDDGLIGTKQCECRLSDGYGTHYVYIKK